MGLPVLRDIDMYLLETYVLFIPFSVFGFRSLLAMKLQKYENNICLHFARQDGQDGKKQ